MLHLHMGGAKIILLVVHPLHVSTSSAESKASAGGGSSGINRVRAAMPASAVACSLGRILEAWEGWVVNIPGRAGPAGNPVLCSRTARTLSCG